MQGYLFRLLRSCREANAGFFSSQQVIDEEHRHGSRHGDDDVQVKVFKLLQLLGKEVMRAVVVSVKAVKDVKGCRMCQCRLKCNYLGRNYITEIS